MSSPVWVVRARVPGALTVAGLETDGEGLALVDLAIDGGKVIAVEPSAPGRGDVLADQDGGQVWPCFVDMHTHLDKGHIWPRMANPDGSWEAALTSVREDRAARWSTEDVAARMEFGLRCAHAHGVSAIRTHLDSIGDQTAKSWAAFAETREAWAGRIDLQAVALFMVEDMDDDPDLAVADVVADHGGVLGAVTRATLPDLDARLDRLFEAAKTRDLDLDFHVDEAVDPDARTLPAIARATSRHGYGGRVVVGHCCALSVQPDRVVEETLGLVADAGIAVVSLPMCNLFLQDRQTGRTPRLRGVTLLHEMRARGIPVACASDNCRDPFFGFGDHDTLEVYREAARIAHLDRPAGGWADVVTASPADMIGLGAGHGRILPGRAADLILFRARSQSELLSRPQSDRIVLRAGRPIDRMLPDYRDLDPLMA